MTESIRIGQLRDVPPGAGHDFGGNALRMVIDAVNAQGGLHGRPVELVERAVGRAAADPHDTLDETLAAWDALVNEDRVLGLIGPCLTPSALAVHDRVETIGVPAIHWAGTDEACGAWHFQFQAGSLPDEGPALAYLLARRGERRVACFHSEGRYGEAYLRPFLTAARPLGIEVMATQSLPLGVTELGADVDAARRSGAEAVVAMGLFGLGLPLAKTIKATGWAPRCYGNCGFALIAALNPQAREILSGWIATDMFDPHNVTNQSLLDRYERRYGLRPTSASAAFGHDLGMLMVEGIRRAPELTRAGLRRGLEALRDIPSATGGAGSRMGFGPNDRFALKGPRLFLFQEIRPDGLRLYPA